MPPLCDWMQTRCPAEIRLSFATRRQMTHTFCSFTVDSPASGLFSSAKDVDSSPNPHLTTQRQIASPFQAPLCISKKSAELHTFGQFVKCIQIEASATVAHILPTPLFTTVTFLSRICLRKDASLSTINLVSKAYFSAARFSVAIGACQNLWGQLRCHPKTLRGG